MDTPSQSHSSPLESLVEKDGGGRSASATPSTAAGRLAVAAGRNRAAKETVQEAFCRTFSWPADDFSRLCLRATLYPHARLLVLFGGHKTDWLSPDRSLVDYCGALRSSRAVDLELRDFARLPENRHFARRVLYLHVSGRRLRALVARCLGEA